MSSVSDYDIFPDMVDRFALDFALDAVSQTEEASRVDTTHSVYQDTLGIDPHLVRLARRQGAIEGLSRLVTVNRLVEGVFA